MNEIVLNRENATELLRRFRAYAKYMSQHNRPFEDLKIKTAEGYSAHIGVVRSSYPQFRFSINKKEIGPLELLKEICGGTIEKSIFDNFR